MNARIGALIWALAVLPASAQVQWSASGSPAATTSSVPANSQLNKVCRVTNGANTYVGTERNNQCHYAIGATNETANSYTIATGLGKWEGAGQTGAPLVGNINGTAVLVCRAIVDGVYYAGYTLGSPAFCQIAAPSGFVARANFEQLYDFDFTGPFQIRNREGCMAFGSYVFVEPLGPSVRQIALSFQPCRGESVFQWRLQQVAGELRIESLSTPGFCIASSNPTLPIAAQLSPCSAAMQFVMAWDSDTTYTFRNPASGAILRRFSDGFLANDPVSASTTGGPGAFEVLTIPEASRRLSVLSYNIMMLPKSQFPQLAQVERAAYIPSALDREGLLADVVAFQEGFEGEGRFPLRRNMKSPYGYDWTSHVPNWPQEVYDLDRLALLPINVFMEFSVFTNGGAFLMSRWPIEKMATHRFRNSSRDALDSNAISNLIAIFSDTSGADAFAAKGVSYARINKLGRRYHVFTTHLQAGPPDDEGAVRAAQLAEINAFALLQLAGSSPDDGIIYTGDFNFDMETDPVGYNLILQSLNAAFVNAPRPPGTTNASQPSRWTVDSTTNGITNEREGGNSFLDYIFLGNNGAQVDRARYNIRQPKHSSQYEMNIKILGTGGGFNTFDLSDHGAILGRFVFRPRPVAVPPVELPKFHDIKLITATGNGEFQGNVYVDGGLADTPNSYNWAENVERTISAPSILPGPPGFRYSFIGWTPNQTQTFTFNPFGPVTFEARYDVQPQLSAEIVPFDAGTVSNLGFYPRGSIVQVLATPRPGFRFLRLETPNASTEASQSIRFGDQPIRLRAVFESSGPPRLSVSTDGSRRYLPNDVIQLGFRMTNSSPNGASNPRISRVLGVQILSGTGNFQISAAQFANFPAIAPNTTSPYVAPMQIYWPSTAQRIRMTVEITADGGYVTTQVLNLTR